MIKSSFLVEARLYSLENLRALKLHGGKAKDQLSHWEFEGQFPVVRAVHRGVAFQEICQYATDNEIDMIVMGTHGRTGIAHALIGSVAERVVRKAPCPVLAVRQDSAAAA